MTTSPEAVNDIIIKGIPLLFLARTGNEFGGRVLEVLRTSAMAKVNPVLKSLAAIAKKEGRFESVLIEQASVDY